MTYDVNVDPTLELDGTHDYVHYVIARDKTIADFRAKGKSFLNRSEDLVIKLTIHEFHDVVREALLSLSDSPSEAIVHWVSLNNEYVVVTLWDQGSFRMVMHISGSSNDIRSISRPTRARRSQRPILLDSEFPTILTANVNVGGSKEDLIMFFDALKSKLKTLHVSEAASMIRWIYPTVHGNETRSLEIKKDWEIADCYYPWLGCSLNDYYQEFLESKAQILVLYGPPGTGKTSFIRDLICETGSNAIMSYDDRVLSSDSMFVNFLTDAHYDVIVVEDADELLTSSRGDHNKVVAKILNVSDGLLKLPRKKLIFTTNLDNVGDIDPAIIRPGRCFDALFFRKLTREEGEVVAKHMGIEPIDKREVSLSELFTAKVEAESSTRFERKRNEIVSRKIGFA
jgi:hypothetical protein